MLTGRLTLDFNQCASAACWALSGRASFAFGFRWESNMERDIVERLRSETLWQQDELDYIEPLCREAAAEIETLRAALDARDAEIAAVRRKLSDMATKYSWAVDTFNTGFSGYEAVLLHQKRIAEEGPPSMWRGPMRDYAARATIGKDKGNE
jgi:hypothetical protein